MRSTYPTVDIAFFKEHLAKNPKIKCGVTTGSTLSYISGGSKPLGERLILIRNLNGQVDYDFAVITATRLKCLPELMEWLEKNRNWKDGTYLKK